MNQTPITKAPQSPAAQAGQLSIAMLGHKRVPSREGGVEIVVGALASRMAKRGHRVTCYNRRGQPVAGVPAPAQTDDTLSGVRILTVFTIDRKGLAAMSASVFAAIRCAFGKYDVVHFHAEGPCAMLWLPKLFGKRCIATVHGLDWAREKWQHGFARKYILFGERVAARYADEIIVLSRAVQTYFMQTYGRQTRYIPNGIDAHPCLPADEISARFGLTHRGDLLFVGRLVPEKGLRYLIAAYQQLATDLPLVIAGGSSDTDDFVLELRALVNDDPRIVFTGFVQGDLLAELYSNAALYVLPSDLEGMPLTLLEAMSYGNCCVVSDIAECVEVVGDHGVCFAKGDVTDLAATLQALLQDPDRMQAYRNDAASYVHARFNWDEVVTQTLALYRTSL